MDEWIKIREKFNSMDEDPRIGPVHLSLFLGIIRTWEENHFKNPISSFSWELMAKAKISGGATYFRVIRELHQYGYIQYTPSYDHGCGSQLIVP
jgi:hypothetical protein